MSEAQYVEAPGTGEHDDPRTLAYVNVDDLLVDQNVQRPVTPEKIRALGEWDWHLVELPTVTVREDGTMVVTEGQHRVTKRQTEHPDSMIWVTLLSDVEDERAIALAISKGRRSHTKYDQWLLEVGQGLPHEVAAEQVLAEMGLRIAPPGSKATPTDIGTVATVSKIIHSSDDAGVGAQMLRAVLSTLVQAFPQEAKRWERSLMLAVAEIITANQGNLDMDRLIGRLGRQPAVRWTQLGQNRRPGQSAVDAIGVAVTDEYNRSLRTRRIAW